MKLLTTFGCLLASWGCGCSLQAATPLPIDRPSPPPCAADGSCYPNISEWGYYPGRWRQWPGVELVPIPSGQVPTPAEQLGPDVSPYETPPPETEDAAAPPSTTKKQVPSESASEQAGPTTEGVAPPTAPGAPGTPGAPLRPGPGYESPPTVPLGEPTSDLDPPPAPPFAISAGYKQARSSGAVSRPSGQTESSLIPPSSDAPPAPPWVYHSAAL